MRSRLDDLADSLVEGDRDVPAGIVRLASSQVAEVADVIADAVLVDVAVASSGLPVNCSASSNASRIEHEFALPPPRL